MRKLFTSFAVLLVLLCSCGWEVPEKVSIKTKADYNFSVGEVSKDFSEFFTAEKMIESFSTSGNDRIELYDYNPGGNSKIQHFLMKLKIQEIPVDFASYFDESKLSGSIKGMSFSQEIKVPEIDASGTQKIDLGSSIKTTLNNIVTVTGTCASDVGITWGAGGAFAGASFSAIEYQSGVMKINAYTTGTVTLNDGTKDIGTAFFNNGVAKIDMAGKKIFGSGMKLKFSDPGSSFIATMDTNSNPKKVEGLTVPTAFSLPSGNINLLPASEGFVSCEVGTGSLTMDASTPNWSGATLTYTVNLTGGLTTSVSDVTPTVSLAGKTITKDAIAASYTVGLTFTNATITFADSPAFAYSLNVTGFNSVTASAEGITTNVNEDFALGDDFNKYVNKITFNSGTGIKGKYTNTLPSGNTVKLENVTSAFLGIAAPGKSCTFDANKTDEDFAIEAELEHTETITPTSKVSFNIDFVLPGYNSTAKTFTVTNIEPNTTYKIGMDVEPNIDWKQIVIDSSLAASSDTIDTGVEIGQIFDSFKDYVGNEFKDAITIKSLPVYLYCTKPEGTGMDIAFEGTIKAKAGTSEIKLLENATMSFKAMPVLTKTGNKVVTNTFNSPSIQKDFADLVNGSKNESNATLKVNYALQLKDAAGGGSSLTLEKSNFTDSTKNNFSIGIYAFVDLPFEFNTAETTIDLAEMMGTKDKTDLFDRSDATDMGDIQKYIDVIKSCRINYKSSQLPFVSSKPMGFSFKYTLNNNGNTRDKTVILPSLENGSYDFAEIVDLLETYPFKPVLKLTIPENTGSNTLYLPRDVGMKMKINVCISTDGTVELFGGDK